MYNSSNRPGHNEPNRGWVCLRAIECGVKDVAELKVVQMMCDNQTILARQDSHYQKWTYTESLAGI